MPDIVYYGIALFLVLNLFVAMIRVFRGPTLADSLLATQLFGSTSVAVLLLLAEAGEQFELRNIALVFALLSAVTAVAFVRREWSAKESSHDNG